MNEQKFANEQTSNFLPTLILQTIKTRWILNLKNVTFLIAGRTNLAHNYYSKNHSTEVNKDNILRENAIFIQKILILPAWSETNWFNYTRWEFYLVFIVRTIKMRYIRVFIYLVIQLMWFKFFYVNNFFWLES